MNLKSKHLLHTITIIYNDLNRKSCLIQQLKPINNQLKKVVKRQKSCFEIYKKFADDFEIYCSESIDVTRSK